MVINHDYVKRGKHDVDPFGSRKLENEKALIPIEQETIMFRGLPLVVVRLPDGRPGVVLRWICENLHLAPTGQVTRIKRTEAIADDLVAITAPATSFMAADAALCGSVMPSVMCRSTFSMTTIASSTTSPVAKVMPNKVSVLMEKPSSLTKINVPISDTGIAIAGMNVLRQSCRKM